MSVFDYVKSINNHKEIEITSDYSQFVINRNFSYFPDTLSYAAEINQYHIDDQSHFNFLFHSIRPRNRFTKWAKKGEIESLEMIKTYYQVSDKEAMSISKLLSEEQLAEIKTLTDIGG
jgi:hypothetical protein